MGNWGGAIGVPKRPACPSPPWLKYDETHQAALAAFTEAVAMINKDKKWAAQVYLNVSNDKKSSVADIQKQLEDVNIQFTTTPRNVQKYADFMFDAGYIKTRAASWKDLYFPEIHDQPGS